MNTGLKNVRITNKTIKFLEFIANLQKCFTNVKKYKYYKNESLAFLSQRPEFMGADL